MAKTKKTIKKTDNKVEIMVNGKKHIGVKVPDKALDEVLHYLSAQIEECPHKSSWEDCSECEEGNFE